jgi:signal transduction histidine kinase
MKDLWVDAAVAVPVAAFTLIGTVGEILGVDAPTPPLAGGVAIAVTASAMLVGRRRWPARSAALTFAVSALYPVLGYTGWAPILPLFVSVFSLAAYSTTRRGTVGALAVAVLAYLLPLGFAGDWLTWRDPAAWAPAIGLAWIGLLGASARQRRLESEEKLRQAAAMAEARARQRVADDRLQVARELHDVLAHTISVIAVQSGLALDSLDDDPDTSRSAMTTVRASTKEALAELRATLTLLRGLGESPLPQPQLAQLPALVAQASSAGLSVALDVDAPALPPVVELTAYRVVQEALTNVIRHAHAGKARVTVCVADAVLHVCVDTRLRHRLRPARHARTRRGGGRHLHRRPA